MNYVKEVAKLLGVELNEEFELMGEPGTRYRLVEVSDFDHCLEVKYSENWYTTSENSDEASLEDLICGRYTIKKLSKPETLYDYLVKKEKREAAEIRATYKERPYCHHSISESFGLTHLMFSDDWYCSDCCRKIEWPRKEK